jgi:hypothetical protein
MNNARSLTPAPKPAIIGNMENKIIELDGYKIIELDGSSSPLEVRVAGYKYVFVITQSSDASFKIVEISPDNEMGVIAEGSEW